MIVNEQLIKERKRNAADSLRTYLLEKEAEWWQRPGHMELFNDLCPASLIDMTDGDIERITEEISRMAWQQDISYDALGNELNALAELISYGDPNHADTLRNLILRLGIKLNNYKAQAEDGYNQAKQAFQLLMDIYYFLDRLDNMHRLASWAARRVAEFMQRIEEFLPGLSSK